MAIEQDELLFGRIAVHNSLISREQLDACVEMKENGDGRPLGKIILAEGFITDKQFRAIDKNRKAYLEKKGGDPAVATASPPSSEDHPEPPADPEPASDPGSSSIALDESGPAIPSPSASDRVSSSGNDADGKESSARVEGSLKESARLQVPTLRKDDGEELREIIAKSREIGASDVHIPCKDSPACRRHGDLQAFDIPAWGPEKTKREILAILGDEDRERFVNRLDLDTCLELEDAGRLRANVFMQRRGVSAVFRIIKDDPPTLEELGLPETLQRFTTYGQGIVLVTGPAGSGKSSTLAALIDMINESRKENIITLEDPIEYVFECKKCNVIQRQVERHTESWSRALRAALRQDPDVIMVGEMRDLDTISLAVTAAETGHLVLATLHTSNATRTVDRMLDVFPPKEQAQIRAMVSESLRGVISQQLIPRKDGKGRVPALEILFSTPAVGNLIREERTFQLFSVLQTGKKLGMKLMDDSLAELVKRDLITEEEALSRAVNKKRFQ